MNGLRNNVLLEERYGTIIVVHVFFFGLVILWHNPYKCVCSSAHPENSRFCGNCIAPAKQVYIEFRYVSFLYNVEVVLH